MNRVSLLTAPPSGARWFIFDVMRKGNDSIRPGRPRNEWAAALIDMEPEQYASCSHEEARRSRFCWLDLGRHRNRDDAWDHAEQMIATRH